MIVKDPVCEMEVDPQAAAAQLEHNGATYYFCSTACSKRFAQDPQVYTKSEAGKCCGRHAHHSHDHHGGGCGGHRRHT